MAVGATASVASLGILAGCTQQETAKPEPVSEKETESGAPEEQEIPPATESANKVYVVDTFKPKPGDGKAFLDEYLKTYRPMAEGGGMAFVNATIAPPLWLENDSNIVQIVWTLDDIAVAAWAMSSATRYNPAYVEWWAAVRKRVLERDRSYFASEEYMEVLNNV
ncbi:hypothetical protein [Raoultibacter phocaeensis]|uniref:hypothetical protein n=1 Tax=Raoultibacter phocaeensis TaxID=2479841 RepID=UPI0011193CA2|nr:hypothetical protein [Raoultibacter phocaeensis]